MGNYQREIYQPSLEDGPTYDLRDEDVEDARARLPLLIVIALLVLAAFAGVVWLAYNQGVQTARVDTPTVIAAPSGPVRTAPPPQTGGVPYTGLKVYEAPEPPAQEAQNSTLVQDNPASVAGLETPAAPATKPVPPTPAKPAQVASVPAAPQPAPAVKPAPAAQAGKASAVSGGAVLQVGAYPSQQLAENAWAAFSAQHANLIQGLSRDIQMADLGAKGVWYRVRIGPFADKAAAAAACGKLKADGGNCFVATP